MDAVAADGARVTTVIGVAVIAGLIEAASMLPYLGGGRATGWLLTAPSCRTQEGVIKVSLT